MSKKIEKEKASLKAQNEFLRSFIRALNDVKEGRVSEFKFSSESKSQKR